MNDWRKHNYNFFVNLVKNGKFFQKHSGNYQTCIMTTCTGAGQLRNIIERAERLSTIAISATHQFQDPALNRALQAL